MKKEKVYLIPRIKDTRLKREINGFMHLVFALCAVVRYLL
ncbi:hypothetical protein B4089_3563 [Bacillus licheniformis]|nr:hypothetical protein B4089_3563 [Bacillus licheniformis]